MISTILSACLLIITSNANVINQPTKLPNNCQKPTLTLPLTNIKSVCTPCPIQTRATKTTPPPCNDLQVVNLPTSYETLSFVRSCNSLGAQKSELPKKISPCQNLPAVKTSFAGNSRETCLPPPALTETNVPCLYPIQKTATNNVPSLNQLGSTTAPVTSSRQSQVVAVSSSFVTQSPAPVLPSASVQLLPSFGEPCNLKYPTKTSVNKEIISPSLFQGDASVFTKYCIDSPVNSDVPGIANNSPSKLIPPVIYEQSVLPSCGLTDELILPNSGCYSLSLNTFCGHEFLNVPLPLSSGYSDVQLVPNLPVQLPCSKPLQSCLSPSNDRYIPPIPFENPATCQETKVIESNVVNPHNQQSNRKATVCNEAIGPYPPTICPNQAINCQRLSNPQLPPSICQGKPSNKLDSKEIFRPSIPVTTSNLLMNFQELPKPKLHTQLYSKPIFTSSDPYPAQFYVDPCKNSPQVFANSASLGCRESTISCGTAFEVPLLTGGGNSHPYHDPLLTFLNLEAPCLAPVVPMVSIPELNMDVSNSYCGNLFLPAASPISPYNAVTPVLPPVELSMRGGNYRSSRKPIPPPPFV